MNDHVKTAVDVISIGAVLATLVKWLPAAAALASLIWTAIRIWETRTVQGWVRRLRK